MVKAAATLEIQLVADVARLQADMRAMQSSVEGAMGGVSRSMKGANDNTANYSRAVAALKGQLDPAWSSMQKYKQEIVVANQALAQGAISHAQYVQAVRNSANAAGLLSGAQQRLAQQGKAVTASAGAQRAGMQQLSFQIGDVTQQFALGTSPMIIFAQQGGQVVQAMSMMQGGAKGLIGFLAGPWGTVILGSILILGSLWSAHNKATDATDEHKKAAEDLVEATKSLNEATVRSMQSTEASIASDIAKAEALRLRAQEARKAAIAELELAKTKAAGAEQSVSPGAPGYSNTFNVGAGAAQRAKASEFDAEIKRQNATIAANEQTIRLKRGEIVQGRLNEHYDAGAAAAGKYARTLDGLNKQLGAGSISERQYAQEINRAMQTRNAEQEAARKAGRTHKERKAALTDEERAYKSAVKAAESYIDALTLEIAKIGKTPAEIRAIEVARAREAAATDVQRAAIDKLSASREAALAAEQASKSAIANSAFDRGTLQPLRDELALIGMTGEARIEAVKAQRLSALASEEEAFKADALARGLTNVNGKWLEYFMLTQDGINAESAFDKDTRAAEAYLDALDAIADRAQTTADIMSSAFGGIGDSIGGLIAGLADFQAAQAAVNEEVASGRKTQAQGAARLATMEARLIGDQIRGVKKLFKEKSGAYKVMQALEMTFAALEMANTIRSIVMDTTKTTSSVANSTARGAADQASGAAKIFSALGPWAFPVVAAMVAVLAGLGLGGGGSVSGPTMPNIEDEQAAAGTGSVLGDAAAKSESIANALEIVAANTNADLEYSNQMLRALRAIEFSIGKLAGNVAKQIAVSGSLFDTSGARIGETGSGGFLGIGASSTKRSLYDLGVTLQSATVGNIIANGIQGSTYQTIEQIKKKSGFFGIGGSTKTSYQTSTGAIDSSITDAISDVVYSLRQGLIEGSAIIGLDGAEAILNAFQVNIGKISFKDMTGQEIEDQLNAIFSKVGDDMAGALLPSLASLQLVGEGLFETFIRVAREYQVIDVALRSIGMEFGAVGLSSIAARDGLVQLFGTLDDFVEQTEFFRDNFLTEAEQIAPIALAVRDELARLGVAGITTRDQFKAAVLGLDLTTVAGREMYASLLAVAPAFDKVAKYAEDANKKISDAFKSTVSEFEGYAKSLIKYRDELRASNGGNRDPYGTARRAFMSTAALAAQGNATGLSGLEGAGKTFLSASKDNASTLNGYLRDVAMVANAVDAGIFAATETADYAQLQLDALTNSASILASIDAGIVNVQSLLGGASAPASVSTVTAGTAATTTSGSDQTTAEIQAMRAESAAANLKIVENTGAILRLQSRWDGDGLLVRTDTDSPLDVTLTNTAATPVFVDQIP